MHRIHGRVSVCVCGILCSCAVLLSGCFSGFTPDKICSDTSELSENVPEAIPRAEEADSYFQGSLFIGDSVVGDISRYVLARRSVGDALLSDAKFLVNDSGIRIADIIDPNTEERLMFRYKGKEKELSDILADIRPERIFLFLGINDLSWGYSEEEILVNYEQLIRLLQKECPKAHLVVMTVTPKAASPTLPWYCRNENFNSTLLNSLAAAQIAFCTDNQIDYVDTNAAVRDENGNIPDEYSSDGYTHFNDAGTKLLLETLIQFAIQEIGDS